MRPENSVPALAPARRLLGGAVAALAVLAAMTAAEAQISDGVVKIGVLTDLSGPAADATGAGSVAAAQMAVEDFGGAVAGRPVKVISANHQLKPDVGSAIARQWYDEEQVDLIVDVPVSAVGLWSDDFAQTSDDEVRQLLARSMTARDAA